MIFMQSLQRNKQQSLKHRMFYLHHQILKHYNLSNSLYSCLLFIEMLQIMYYAIHTTYPDLWPHDITNIIQSIFHFIQFSGIWQGLGQMTLLAFLVIMFFVYLVNVGFILYQVLKKEYKNGKEPNMIAYKYITVVGMLTKTILFIPTVHACVIFIMANSDNYPMKISSDLYGIIATLSIPTLLLLFVNTIDFTIFLRQNNPFSHLPFVSSVTQNQQIRTIIKLLMGMYGALVHEQTQLGKIFCIAVFVANVFYLSKVYHSPSMLKSPYDLLTQLAPCLTIWMCICSILQQFIYPGQTVGLLFMTWGCMIVPFFWVQLKSRYRSQIMYSNYKFITSPQQLLYYNYECLNCVNNIYQVRNLIYLEGILNYHISQCKKTPQTCVCFKIRQSLSKFKLEQDRLQLLEEKQLWFKFIKYNLTEIKEKYRSVPEISMLLAYIERDQLNNKFKALHNLQEPSNFSSGLKIEFLNYHYLRQIEERMLNQDRISNQKKTVDVNKFLEFENNFGKLEKAIQQSTLSHLTFWSNLSSQRASKKKLIGDGKKISEKVQQTRKLYETLIEINPSNLHCLIIYANYMKIIVNNPQIYQKSNEAIKIIKRNILNSSKLNNDPEKEKYGDNAVTGIVIISGERQNIGVIKHCNSKINELIKYSPHQLLGQNVNILMPKFIGAMHDDILMSYLELTQSKYDNSQRLAPMIDKDNYLVFARILTKPLPSLFNGLELVGSINLVTESHIDHPGQVPKYVLYRTDSGQVQALSQSCDSQFNYRINKIDENHQTSSQLTFTSLFSAVKDSQLTQVDKSVKSKVKISSQDSDHNQINVEVYLRHQIYYFGVKLKLLYFFSLKSYKNMSSGNGQKDPQTSNSIYKKIMVQQQQAQGLKNYQSEKTTEIAKEKKIRELMRKKNSAQYQPLALKILSRFGYLVHLAYIIIVIILLVTDLSSNSYLSDFLKFSKTCLQSESQITQINYFSRLKHLSYFYPDQLSKEFQFYSNNITQLSSQLQKKQFSLVQYALAASSNGLAYSSNPTSWTMTQSLQIENKSSTLDVNVFDYITGASHFESAQIGNINFPLLLLDKRVNSSQYIEFFHLRYTGLFQTIPNKIKHYESTSKYYNDIQNKLLLSANVQIGSICTGIVGMLIFCIPLLICLQRFIDKTVMLFGYMNSLEIQKQVNNCNVFLEIFFHDSYRVKLSYKKKNHQVMRYNSFGADDIKLGKLKSKHGENQGSVFGADGKKKGFNSMNSEFQIQGMEKPRRGSILQSAQKIQDLQKQFHDRTQHQIQGANSGSGHQILQQEKEQMLAKINYEDDDSIYEKLEKTKDSSKLKYILVIVVVALVFLSYFVARFVINQSSIKKNHEDIQNLKMAGQNLNLMKRVKLYSIQSVIDNQQFQSYPLLSNITAQYVSDLYEHQRRYNTYIYPAAANLAVILGDDRISSLVRQSLCTQDNINLYMSSKYVSNMYPPQSYSPQQCLSLQDEILQQGLRPGLIAFTQILLNFTQAKISSNDMAKSDKFQSILKMQKYLQGLQLFYLEKLELNIWSQLDSFRKLQIIICIIMILLILALVILVWWPMMRNLYGKIASSLQILGLIPIRIFIKNSKLAKQYQNFISQMVE